MITDILMLTVIHIVNPSKLADYKAATTIIVLGFDHTTTIVELQHQAFKKTNFAKVNLEGF